MTPLPQNSLEDARRQLANCVLFRGLVTGERDAIVDRARMRHFAAGEPIFLMGSPGASMMAVLSGTVRISIPSHEGREIVLAVLQPGEVFGEIALLDGKERTADAHATTACAWRYWNVEMSWNSCSVSPTLGPGLSRCFVTGCVQPTGRWLKSPCSNCRYDLPRCCSA